MAIKISNEGEAILLAAMVGQTAAANFKLRLYTSNTTPADTDTVATYTEMGAVQGYTPKTLTTTSWGAAVAGTGSGSSSSNQASIAYAQQTFTADGTGGSQTAYGYIITDSAGTKLIGAEKFPAPETYATSGDVIKITPQLQLGTQ